MEPGLSEDSKPSAVVDYTSNENVLLRAVRDELRRVRAFVEFVQDTLAVLTWFGDPLWWSHFALTQNW